MAQLHNNLYLSCDPTYEMIFNQDLVCIEKKNYYRHIHRREKEEGLKRGELIKNLYETKTPIIIDDPSFLYIADYDNNFHHFILDLLPDFHYFKSIRRRVNKNTKLIIRENSNFSYQFLKLLGIEDSNIIKLKNDELYLFKNIFLIHPHLNKKTMTYINETTNSLYKQPIEHKPDKIILIRKNNKRVCVNYDMFKQIGQEYGFFPYSPEEDSLSNQISVIYNCSFLLCELGAGCSNIFFMRPNQKMIILDFFPTWGAIYRKFNNKYKNHELQFVQCKKLKGNQHNCSWRANIIGLRKTLDSMIES